MIIPGERFDESPSLAAMVDRLQAKLDLATKALREMKEAAERYMWYHDDKFYQGQGNTKLVGLWPEISKAQAALHELEKP